MSEQPVGAALDRSLIDNYESIEAAEKSIDTYIEHRYRQGDSGRAEVEAAWEASERKHRARREAESRQKWAEYHRSAIVRHQAVLTDLIRYHEAEARKHEAQMIEDGKGAA